MTCPTFSGLRYRNKNYSIVDKRGFDSLPHPRDLFELKDGVWSSSIGYDCKALYGFYNNMLCIDSFVWRPGYKGTPKEEVIINGRKIEPEEIHRTMPVCRGGKWIEKEYSLGFKYEGVNYPIDNINGKMLITSYEYPDEEGRQIKVTRLVLTLKDSMVISEDPWIPGGNLHGLIDKGSLDYYTGKGYTDLLKEGFTKEELRATGRKVYFSFKEQVGDAAKIYGLSDDEIRSILQG